MPPGSTLISVPFAEKDGAKKLGARWNAERRSWYVPPGIDVSLFSRWRIDESAS
jgi:putative DNA primase/helicase